MSLFPHLPNHLRRNVMPPLLAGLMGLVAMPTMAAETAASQGLPLWELGIGAGLYNQPNYPGSDVRSTTLLPFPYLIYRGDWFRIDRTVQGIFYETQRLKVDFSASGTGSVDSDDSDARQGMPDLDPVVEIGPAVNLLLSDPARFDSLWARVAARAAYSVDTDDWSLGRQGWSFETRLRYQRPLSETLQFSTEASATFANRDYLGYFYNVAAPYATPDRPAYQTDAGYAGARLGVGLSGLIGSSWRWSVFGAYHNLHGAAFSDSPLVDSKHNFSVGATVAWMFWKSERRVTPKNTSGGSEFDTPPLLFDF